MTANSSIGCREAMSLRIDVFMNDTRRLCFESPWF